MGGGTLGVLLAGGRGTRLGANVPKALVVLGGETLLARARRTLEGACDAVVVVAPPKVGRALATPFVPDAAGGAGPLAGIVAGLAARPFGVALVLGVDFPLIRAATLGALAEALGDAPAVMPAPGGAPQPLACAVAAAAAPRLAAAWRAGERSARAALVALGARLLDDAALDALPGGAAAFLNCNRPADLAEASRRLSRGAEA
uniref:Probable molybdenum cofactor guanylyltransferase n=1 Tax=Eiseniibacteriota bacterium TaxID=2212470 RepID=A0A832I483_UNCEI